MSKKSSIIFIFLDGVGIGEASPLNPFFVAKLPFLPFYGPNPLLPDKTPIKPIDAQLDIPGMPMSATGQTSLFTGVNIPKLIGRHKDSYPDTQMRNVIRKANLFSMLKDQGLNVRFLNAYPGNKHLFTREYIKIIEDGQLIFSDSFPLQFRGMVSTTTCMMLTAGMMPYGEDEIRQGKSLYQDFTNKSLQERGMALPYLSPVDAAEVIFQASREFDFLLYEFFQTDLYGHGYSFEESLELIDSINGILENLISCLDPVEDTLIISSDHGNLEDFSTRLHTSNPVPLLAWGKYGDVLRKSIDRITDVTPAIVEVCKSRVS